MFAMLYMTGADALISVWNDKAKWLFWRPITAVREAAGDGNPDTVGDTGWLPLLNTPPDEVVDARVYSGIHCRTADDDGEALGYDVARDGLRHAFERD
jgi:hypothetical protein